MMKYPRLYLVLCCNWSEYEGKAWERGYFQYTIPSFPVFTVTLREVKLQWEDDNGDVHLFDGFMRECELLNHPLPAIARIPHSYRHAGRSHPYTNWMHVHLSRPHKKQPHNIILMTRKTRVACIYISSC